MKKTLLLLLLTACALMTFASAEFDGYLVRLNAAPPMLFSEGTDGDMDYIAPNLYKVDDLAAVEALRESGLLVHAEKNEIIELFDTTELETVDTYYSWTDVIMKVPYAEELGLTGKGVRVAVIDSGVHRENKNLQNADIAVGYDYVVESTEMQDDDVGHGTKVIQMIVGDGASRAVRGTAPEATVVPLRCFYVNESNAGVAKTEDLIQAMRDAVDVYECDVVSISWGFNATSEELRLAAEHISESGAILVSAVGNVTDSSPQGTVIYPAAYDCSVGVGSVDSTYTVASTSQQTEAVDACAPGVKVIFYNTSDTLVYSSGTSFAAPCVAGVAALIRQLQPEFSTASFRALIADRAVDLGDEGYDTSYGHGFVCMDKLLEKSWMFDEGGAVGWLRNDGSTLVKATYEASGKMLSAGFTRATSAIEALTKSFDEGETAAFFLTDSDSKPLTAAIRTQ